MTTLTTTPVAGGAEAECFRAFSVSAALDDDTTVTCGVEYGGLGSNTELLKYRCDAGVPFLRARRVP